MSMPSFQMSRTGKILIGVLLAAAAIFFWVNFFVQDAPPEATQPTPAPSAAASVPGGSAPAGAANDDAATGDGASPTVEADAGEAPAVAVDVPQPEVTTRDLVVADLPFLITEPVPTADAGAEAEGDDATGADRPGTALRATINPFAPVVRPAQPAPAATTAATPASGADVTEVEVPEAPEVEAAAAPEPVVAPAPAALAPPSPQAGTLPRALPGGTLPSTPALLRGPRRAPDAPAVRDVIDATAAGVRVPGAPVPTLEAADRDAAADAPSDDLAPIDRMAADGAPRGTDADPLAAGVTPLSAYLRDNNVTFTGAVLGPVSVGVFRTADRSNPIVVALGSSLPDTDIVLTDLTGSQAQFSQDEAKQILSLNLRR